MATHLFNIQALNAIVVKLGGTGGHSRNIAALNEWATLLGGDGGHTQNIAALNEIAILAGSSGGHQFTLSALSSIGVELDAAGMPYFSTIEALNQIVEVAGGDGPWWDESSLVDIDFVNDRAWTAADGEVAISTLVGADPDSDNSFGPTDFLADNMEADGYHFILDNGLPQGTMSLAAIGVLETILLAGATFRVQWKWRDTGIADDTVLALAKSDGSNVNYLWVNGVSGRVSFSDWNGSFEKVLDGSIDLDAGDHNCVAATVAGSRAEFSVNGSDAQAVEDTFDAIPSGTTVALLSLAPTSVLQTLTVYTPLPDTADLPALSALP